MVGDGLLECFAALALAPCVEQVLGVAAFAVLFGLGLVLGVAGVAALGIGPLLDITGVTAFAVDCPVGLVLVMFQGSADLVVATVALGRLRRCRADALVTRTCQ